MKSKNVWGDRLQPPFKAVGDHIGVDLPGGRAMFFTRRGGVSGEPFEELNVGLDTNDYMPAVEENRQRVAELIGIPQRALAGVASRCTGPTCGSSPSCPSRTPRPSRPTASRRRSRTSPRSSSPPIACPSR